MFRNALLVAALMAATLNAATIRFDWVDVEVKGPSIPGRGYVPLEDVIDYEINYNGHTIKKGDKDSYLTARNQGFANNFLIVKGKLLLQGEVGSQIKFRKRMPARNPPYAWSLTIQKAGVYNRDTKGYDVDYFVHLGDRITDEERHRGAVANDLPLGFHGVLIGENPRLVESPNPTPPQPVDPVTPPTPVNPANEPALAQLRQLRSNLIAELYRVQQQIAELE